MAETPERIWAWEYREGKRDDLQKGGWDDKPDRGLKPYVPASLLDEAVEALEESTQYVEVLHSLMPNGQARKDLIASLRRSRATLAKIRSKT